MFGMRVPVPVWFAAVAFALLLTAPEIGSSAARMSAVAVAPCHSPANPANDLTYWQAYRAASRQWSSAKINPDYAAGAGPLPVLR